MKILDLLLCLSSAFLCFLGTAALATPSSGRTFSIITGANGYVGKAVVNSLLSRNDQDIYCLVREHRVAGEKEYWKGTPCVTVLPYDMLDGGATVKQALASIYKKKSEEDSVCVYHIASWFAPTEEHELRARENVEGTVDLVRVLADFPKCRVVVTSSMAAIRATSQEPKNGKWYTAEDWNTVSKLGEKWGSSYQWSKAESERQAWKTAKGLDVAMVSLCPSFVFGPPVSKKMTSSFSTELVAKWIQGQSEVQSRLFVDIRDLAEAHVIAGTLPEAIGKRMIVSTERRLPSQKVAEIFQKICLETGRFDPDDITYDASFTGGAIAIGDKEVDSEEILKNELGITLRNPEETMADMCQYFVQTL